MKAAPVTLQISLAPSDFRHAELLLPHQIKTWRSQVSEILITVDFHRSAGRFAAEWELGRERILTLANSIEGAKVLTVDYEAPARDRVGKIFFGGTSRLPAKDFRGGPFYSYFYALAAATHDYVFHIDSDMFFGGGSETWVAEAVEVMRERKEVLVTAPLPGPPSQDGTLRQLCGDRKNSKSFGYDFKDLSTRLFLIDRRRFASDLGMLSPCPPSLRNCVKAWWEGNPAADLPEHLFSRRMAERGLVRHDFLGEARGMWSLHPPYRCETFYAALPNLIKRIENNDMPDQQRGDHDLNDSLVDWSEARKRLRENRWWRRALLSNRVWSFKR